MEVRIPASHELHGSMLRGWGTADLGWNLRNDARTRAPCETCGLPALQDPPCEVRDATGNLLRVEQRVLCLRCAASARAQANKRIQEERMPPIVDTEYFPPPRRSENLPTEDGTTSCECGCGKPLKHGRRFASRGCSNRRQSKPKLPPVSEDLKAWITGGADRAFSPPKTDAYAIVAELAREHNARTLRAAADLREALGGDAPPLRFPVLGVPEVFAFPEAT